MAVQGAREPVLPQNRGPRVQQGHKLAVFLKGHERRVPGTRHGDLNLEVRHQGVPQDQGHPVEHRIHAGRGNVAAADRVGDFGGIPDVGQEIIHLTFSFRVVVEIGGGIEKERERGEAAPRQRVDDSGGITPFVPTWTEKLFDSRQVRMSSSLECRVGSPPRRTMWRTPDCS